MCGYPAIGARATCGSMGPIFATVNFIASICAIIGRTMTVTNN